jgi:hypothetical protein
LHAFAAPHVRSWLIVSCAQVEEGYVIGQGANGSVKHARIDGNPMAVKMVNISPQKATGKM